jgi:hypothetical protein
MDFHALRAGLSPVESNKAWKCRTDFHALQVGLGPLEN